MQRDEGAAQFLSAGDGKRWARESPSLTQVDMMQSSNTALERIIAASSSPPKHSKVIRFNCKISPGEMGDLLRELFNSLNPLHVLGTRASGHGKVGFYKNGLYDLNENGDGIVVGRNPIGGTPGDAMDHEFYVLFPDTLSLHCVVGDGYFQPTIEFMLRSHSRNAVDAVERSLKERIAQAGCDFILL